MKFNLFALVVIAALCASAAVKDPDEPNRFAAYNEAMKPEWGNPMAVEWQDANRSLIAAETSEAVIAAYVSDAGAASALLSRLRGAYGGDPVTLTQIAAVSQWVMGPEPSWACFWKPSPAVGRKVWVKAILDKAEREGDSYIKTFCLDQLRWCAPNCPCVIARIERIASSCDDKAVKDFAAMVIRELSHR